MSLYSKLYGRKMKLKANLAITFIILLTSTAYYGGRISPSKASLITNKFYVFGNFSLLTLIKQMAYVRWPGTVSQLIINRKLGLNAHINPTIFLSISHILIWKPLHLMKSRLSGNLLHYVIISSFVVASIDIAKCLILQPYCLKEQV